MSQSGVVMIDTRPGLNEADNLIVVRALTVTCTVTYCSHFPEEHILPSTNYRSLIHAYSVLLLGVHSVC